MTGPIDPTGRVHNRRTQRRRASDPRPDDLPAPEDVANLPVPVEAAGAYQRQEAPRAAPRKPGSITLDAHLIGQENRRRGLRAGQPAIDAARATYLGAEYSGAADRRPRPGRITKTEI